jgi:hypothetical protein
MTGDLLGLQSAAYLSGTTARPSLQQGDSNFRMTLGRDDPDAGLLGPLHARWFAFGSVTVPSLANVARTSPLGNGFTLSNAPLAPGGSTGCGRRARRSPDRRARNLSRKRPHRSRPAPEFAAVLT